ncbi:MAG: hypothetical protein ACXIUD_08835 [Mongoliitalea sp.]
MKNKYYLCLIILITGFSCDFSQKKQKEIISSNIVTNDNEIIPLSVSSLVKSEKLIFEVPLILPIPICSNDSSLIIYDVGDNKIKLLNLNQSFSEFNPLGSGPSRLGGSYFRGVGYSMKSSNHLLVGSETNITRFNIGSQSFDEKPIDKFPQCINFSPGFSEIFNVRSGNDTLVISQNGIPCLEIGMAEKSFSIQDFESINFLRIKPENKESVNLTLSIPSENEILLKNDFFVKTELFLSYNTKSNSFFGMINPTKHLYEFRLDSNTLNFELMNTWNFELPYSEQHVKYTLNNGIQRELTQDNLNHNFKIDFIKAFESYLVLTYIPSKSTHYSSSSEAPFATHYLVALFNLENEKLTVFSLDYNEIYFLGATNNGMLWFYNIIESEKGKSTVVHVLNINNLIY